MADLSLPVSRLPGIAEVAREVLGLDPWPGCGWEHVVARGRVEDSQ